MQGLFKGFCFGKRRACMVVTKHEHHLVVDVHNLEMSSSTSTGQTHTKSTLCLINYFTIYILFYQIYILIQYTYFHFYIQTEYNQPTILLTGFEASLHKSM